jgi:hypothetical protein
VELIRALGLEVEENLVDAQAQAQAQAQAHLASRQEAIDKLTGGVKIGGLNPGYLHASRLVARVLGVSPGQQAVLVNGRVSFVLRLGFGKES